MTRDISIDLESLSLEPNAMILAIGAVEFDVATGQLGNTFYRTIDITAKGGGGVMDPATVKWWMEQSQEARDRIFADPEAVPLAQALIDFSEWLGFDDSLPEGEYPDVKLWQRGDKDGQWLACAYDGLNLQLPYRYWQLNDQRTITNLFPQDFFGGAGVAHDALSDATIQAKRLMQALAVMQPVLEHAHKQVMYRDGTPQRAAALEKLRQDALMMAYACGLTKVWQAVDNIRRHSMSMYTYSELPQLEKDLDEAFFGIGDEELVLHHLTPENKAKVDRELEELSAKPLADEGDPLAFESVPPCVNLAETAKEAFKPKNQRVVPPEPVGYRCECYVCGEPNGHGGMPCPTMAPKS